MYISNERYIRYMSKVILAFAYERATLSRGILCDSE